MISTAGHALHDSTLLSQQRSYHQLEPQPSAWSTVDIAAVRPAPGPAEADSQRLGTGNGTLVFIIEDIIEGGREAGGASVKRGCERQGHSNTYLTGFVYQSGLISHC